MGMQGKTLFAVLFSAGLAASAAWLPGKEIWSENFETKESLDFWNTSGTKPTWLRGGGPDGNANAVRFSRKTPGHSHLVKKFDSSRFQGKIVLEAWIRAENVKGDVSYLGPKLMLSFQDAAGRSFHPEPKKGFGTYDWRLTRGYITLPEKAKNLRLMIGLESGTGTYSVSGLKIRQARSVSQKEADAAALAERKLDSSIPRGPFPDAKTVYRGVMSGSDLSSEAFAELKKWNVNLMRYQLSPGKAVREKIRTPADYQRWIESEAEYFEKNILPLAEKNKIKIVLDLHFGGRRQTSLLSNCLSFDGKADCGMLLAAWTYLAKRFCGNPNLYGYDLLNEPLPSGNKENPWPRVAQILTDAIRKIDPKTPIIIAWHKTPPFEIHGTNLIYSPHFYTPGEFTHQEVLPGKSERTAYPSAINGVYYDKESLRESLKDIIQYQRLHKVRIYIGEFSVVAWGEGGAQWLKDCVELFEEYGWDWTYHAFREWSGWSVEHAGTCRRNHKYQGHTDRKQVLLDAFRKNAE